MSLFLEAVLQLQAANERMDKRLKRVETEKDELQEKFRTTKMTVESCYQQISELNRELAAKNVQMQV